MNEIEWIERNDIISIKEFKFKNKLLQSEKYSNLLQNKSYHYQYSYKAGLLETEEKKEENGTLCKRNFKDGLIILEEGRDTDGSTNKNIYSYSNGTLLLKEVYRNEQLISKIEFEYEEGRLRLENIYNKHKSIEYLAYIKKYSYSPKNEVEKIELFGRYNSKMYLFNVEETYKENNTVTEIRHEISYHEMFTGYYDFNSMLEELDDDWKQGVKEDMYEKSDFDNNLKSVKEFDAKKNLIKYEASNPDNPGEFYEKSFYHYEYGRKSQLEFVICFGIDSNGSLEEKYITKYYYK